jgi:hypothetical protein
MFSISSFVFYQRERERLKGNEKKAGVGTHRSVPIYGITPLLGDFFKFLPKLRNPREKTTVI